MCSFIPDFVIVFKNNNTDRSLNNIFNCRHFEAFQEILPINERIWPRFCAQKPTGVWQLDKIDPRFWSSLPPTCYLYGSGWASEARWSTRWRTSQNGGSLRICQGIRPSDRHPGEPTDRWPRPNKSLSPGRICIVLGGSYAERGDDEAILPPRRAPLTARFLECNRFRTVELR